MSAPSHLARKVALLAYEAAWSAAAPLLGKLSSRLKEGYGARTLEDFPEVRADVWLQAASGGEAYLAWEILKCLSAPGLQVLATSWTTQGVDILSQAKAEVEAIRPGTTVTPAYLPFDRPSLMRRALQRVRPRLMVLLETELWPGLLAACRDEGVPVILVNGRMTSRSLAHYLLWPALWRDLGPEAVLAISEDDATRFRLLLPTCLDRSGRCRSVGENVVGVMRNIKFDRVQGSRGIPHSANPLRGLIKPGCPLAVFGSVREPEEMEVLEAIRAVLEANPKTVVALFPRHMHRVESWKGLLSGAGLAYAMRSDLDSERNGPAAPGSVVLWDRFGELGAAYGLAKTAFVGGSLKPLGGQNFLEPLTAGVVPVIGPFWSNFAWIGQEIVDRGLVQVARTPAEVADRMALALGRPADRAGIRRKVDKYLSERTGGTLQACQLIEEYLQGVRPKR